MGAIRATLLVEYPARRPERIVIPFAASRVAEELERRIVPINERFFRARPGLTFLDLPVEYGRDPNEEWLAAPYIEGLAFDIDSIVAIDCEDASPLVVGYDRARGIKSRVFAYSPKPLLLHITVARPIDAPEDELDQYPARVQLPGYRIIDPNRAIGM